MADTERQIALLPVVEQKAELRDLPLDLLPEALVGERPTQEFIDSVCRQQLQPIVAVGPNAAGTYSVIAGRRRIMARRAGKCPTISALVYPVGVDAETAFWSLEENEHRSSNPVLDLLVIIRLHKGGLDERQVLAATGMRRATYIRRLKLQRLVPDIHNALVSGKVKVTIAEKISSMSRDAQARLLPALSDAGTITPKDVSDVRATIQAEKTPPSLFAEEENQDARAAYHAKARRLIEELLDDPRLDPSKDPQLFAAIRNVRPALEDAATIVSE